LPKQDFHVYAKICCPLCNFYTTAADKLGVHMVDKHPKRVLRGYHKVKAPRKKAVSHR
jgi:hypothetical protein